MPSVPTGPLCATLTCAVIVLPLPGGVQALHPALAEFLPVPDTEQDGGSFQQQVFHPLRDVGLQVLLVHQAHNQDGLCQADHQQCHANHEVDACRSIMEVSDLQRLVHRARTQANPPCSAPRALWSLPRLPWQWGGCVEPPYLSTACRQQ